MGGFSPILQRGHIMDNKPSVSKLLDSRSETFRKNTSDIISKFSSKLTKAFQSYFDDPDANITWSFIEYVPSSTKSVYVTGSMALNAGQTITMGDNEITLDESNANDYTKVIKFAFPVLMLDLGTADELTTHVKRLTRLGSVLEVPENEFSNLLDKLADEYQERVLNDPSRLDVVTKPDMVSGFTTIELNDNQIMQLKIQEKFEHRTVN